jgi:hypothetical protein
MSPVVRQRLPPLFSPQPSRLGATVLAEAVNDGPMRGLESVAHLLVDGLEGWRVVLVDVEVGAEIVLQVVDAPGGVGGGILLHVGEATLVVRAGLRAGAGVDADLQALGMHIVGEGFHVGELLIGHDVAEASRPSSQVSSMLM